MAQNVTINNISYPGVPSIQIPLTSGTGVAVFIDSSDATATSDDILQGKTAYINGQKISGNIGTISNEQILALFEGE